MDYEDEDDAGGEDPEEEEVVDEDVEIGIGDDEDDEDEDEIEFEFDEDDLEEEEFDEGDEEAGVVEAAEVEAVPATNAEVWASYDAADEEPVRPLLDDVGADPHYQLARDTVLSQVEARKRSAEQERGLPRNLETAEDVRKTMEYIADHMAEEERQELEGDELMKEVDRLTKDVLLTEEDLEEIIIEDEEGNRVIDPQAIEAAGSFDDDRGVEAFPSSSVEEDGENLVYPANGAFTEKDLAELDDQMAAYQAAREQLDDQTYFGEGHTMAYMDVERDWPLLSNETKEEILEVMETSNTMACPEPEMWLMYDRNFNVTNLILASFKHNGEAPIMFTQWMPQLEVYECYADQRAKDFEWTWDDVEAADMDELRRYYKGIGYNDIPKKNPSETGVIKLDDTPMDDEEREMLALENWMDEVYDPEFESLLHDDPDFEARDNPFDPDYRPRSAAKEAAWEEKFNKELETFEREFEEEGQEWRDQFVSVEEKEVREDPEGQAAFRGQLVVACSPEEKDLDDAARIAARCKEEFGQAVVVETRVLGHARKADNVFEVWIESYDIDLLHSRRQAFINPKVWTGPGEVDETQLEYLVEQVRDMISDDTRNSYRYSDYADIEA